MNDTNIIPENSHWCYYMPADQDPKKYGGYVPAMVIADQTGYRPMTGDADQAPWIWGDTLEEAQNAVDIQNSRIGVNTVEAQRIVASSMFPGARPYKPWKVPCPSSSVLPEARSYNKN